MSMCYKDEEQEEKLILPSNCSADTETNQHQDPVATLQPHLSAYVLTGFASSLHS